MPYLENPINLSLCDTGIYLTLYPKPINNEGKNLCIPSKYGTFDRLFIGIRDIIKVRKIIFNNKKSNV